MKVLDINMSKVCIESIPKLKVNRIIFAIDW